MELPKVVGIRMGDLELGFDEERLGSWELVTREARRCAELRGGPPGIRFHSEGGRSGLAKLAAVVPITDPAIDFEDSVKAVDGGSERPFSSLSVEEVAGEWARLKNR